MEDAPRVLFACTANAGRSVVARLLTEHYAGPCAEAFSAGSRPAAEVHPEVAAVLAERGLDASRERPKPFDPAANYDVVITMGCGDACLAYTGDRHEDWPVDDPKGKDFTSVRRIVDDIDKRVRALIADLAPDAIPNAP